MVGTYTMRPSELTVDFIRAIQSVFKDKEIEINIREVPDETDYLLSSPANKRHLYQSLKEAQEHERLVTVAETSL